MKLKIRHVIAILTLLSGCYNGDSENSGYIPYSTESREEAQVQVTEIEIEEVEEQSMIIVLKKIPENSFYWVHNSGSIHGLRDGEIAPVEVKAEKTDQGEKTEIPINPKTFFVIDKTIYLSADFQDGEETVEKFFKQEKGKNPVEIETIPEKPEAQRISQNDGKYNVVIGDYQGQAVSDITRIVDNKFCGRNIAISGYFYGLLNAFNNHGAFIDVSEGLPGVRDAGLYFISDKATIQNKISDSGRMWVY
jgi:Tfp pilus assembly protein PilP